MKGGASEGEGKVGKGNTGRGDKEAEEDYGVEENKSMSGNLFSSNTTVL